MIKKQVKTRNTIQRIKIMKYLKSVKTHPTAEMVYNAVVKEIPSITLATVYRNLHNLANKGKILMFEFNKEYFRKKGKIIVELQSYNSRIREGIKLVVTSSVA